MREQILFQFLVAMVGTTAFAVLFGAPQQHYLFSGIVGGFGWITYLAILEWSQSAFTAYLSAGLILTLLARTASVIRKTPVIVFLIAGIFPLVPGAGIYYTAYYLFSGDSAMAAAKGLNTLIISGAISIGILFGFAFPQWCFDKLNQLLNKGKQAKQ